MSIRTSFNPMGTLGAEPPLPPEFKSIKYIESTGTQYIDTGHKPDRATRWELDTETMNGDGYFPQGCGENVNGLYRLVTLAARNGAWQTQTGNNLTTYFPDAPPRIPAIFDLVGGTVEISGNKIEVETSDKVDYTICLFSRNYQGEFTQSGSFRVYYSKIFHAGELEQHLVPALRMADEKPGMYDLVHGQFYTNIGTGEFLYA